MERDFTQIGWDAQTEGQWRRVVREALAEDLGSVGDLTSQALVEEHRWGQAEVVCRQAGILAGLPGVPVLLAEVEAWLQEGTVLGCGPTGVGVEEPGRLASHCEHPAVAGPWLGAQGEPTAARLRWIPLAEEAQPLRPGQTVGQLQGPSRLILACERILLNLLGRLSGIATLTRQYVEAVSGTGAAIYDTRKTTPGWRLLEKYAVRCGGGRNHRTGLFDAILIKDNHLALCQAQFGPAQAVQQARKYLHHIGKPHLPVEIEVDRLEQLDEVLLAGPDLILLDNMSPQQLRQAVQRRNALNPQVLLEASGGIRLETVRQIAQTGVDRISVGALTHSAPSLDLGLDWLS
ncbi:MAG: carboxylating nicotinate-nucleotide diphosphorylase [Thermoguttaceae bacterium]|nr:carboxylating nicotinate-nucleotide diphosphorylase [Thermoguttaceae bacterium]MDW8037235.1 carboxylating nicotinate-nucleotide diphosphorylase [Thermoguttaceae bacterium]